MAPSFSNLAESDFHEEDEDEEEIDFSGPCFTFTVAEFVLICE